MRRVTNDYVLTDGEDSEDNDIQKAIENDPWSGKEGLESLVVSLCEEPPSTDLETFVSDFGDVIVGHRNAFELTKKNEGCKRQATTPQNSRIWPITTSCSKKWGLCTK